MLPDTSDAPQPEFPALVHSYVSKNAKVCLNSQSVERAHPNQDIEALDSEISHFEQQLPQLRRYHENEWIALHNAKVIAHGQDPEDVLAKAAETTRGGIFLMRQVTS